MSLLIFAVWAVLLGERIVMPLDAARVDRELQCPDPLPRTCKDVKDARSRVVVTLSDGLEVLCDTDTDGGGWLVFQRRVSGAEDFYRPWIDYKYGFGDMNGSFWLGNEKIHMLTFKRRYQLRVDLTYNGNPWFAQYSKFRILGEKEKYRLEVEGYSGNAGDSFTRHNKMAFSTSDWDNDKSSGDCPYNYHGAWWYENCHSSNLNGWWGAKVFGQGIIWYSLAGMYVNLAPVEMKIRPLE